MIKSSAATKLKPIPQGSASGSSTDDIQKRIQERRSQELIIGLCGAIGSGVKALKDTLIHSLESSGYQVEHIRVSNIIAEKSKTIITHLIGSERYITLQDKGDELRLKHRTSILAACAIEEIALARSKFCGDEIAENEPESVIKTTKKIAYIIDQLKHPDEVKLFRSVYPRNFYLLGLIRTEKERRLNLEEEKISLPEIDELYPFNLKMQVSISENYL